MRNPFLIGPNIYLRSVDLADAPAIVGWFNDPEVSRFLRHYRALTIHEEEDFIRRMTMSEHDLFLALVSRETDQFFGVVGLHQVDQRNRHASFGICVGDKTQWGKGHGTAATKLVIRHAFETLNLNRLWLHVYEYNERGLRAYEKAGFRREGRLRQDTFREGRYFDTIVMGVLREEWEAVEYAAIP